MQHSGRKVYKERELWRHLIGTRTGPAPSSWAGGCQSAGQEWQLWGPHHRTCQRAEPAEGGARQGQEEEQAQEQADAWAKASNNQVPRVQGTGHISEAEV